MIFRSWAYRFEDYKKISLYPSSIKGKLASNRRINVEMAGVIVVIVVVKKAP
jgi:hypothetical protein